MGRKLIYGEKTVSVTFKCPESKVENLKIVGNSFLSSLTSKEVHRDGSVTIGGNKKPILLKGKPIYIKVEKLPLGTSIHLKFKKGEIRVLNDVYFTKMQTGSSIEIIQHISIDAAILYAEENLK